MGRQSAIAGKMRYLLLVFVSFLGALEPLYVVLNEQQSDCYFIFCHGLGSNMRQAWYYGPSPDNDYVALPHTVCAFNFPDADSAWQFVLRERVSFGQDSELRRLYNIHQSTRQRYPQRKAVLFGVSRGAATVLNYLALYHPHDVAAAAVEAPYDHPFTVCRYLIKQWNLSALPGIQRVGQMIMQKLFSHFDPLGQQPITTVALIDPQVPVLFVHSLEDELVPFECSVRLVARMRQAGHEKTQLCLITHGEHANVLWGKDGAYYEQMVTHFYECYGIA